MGNLIKKNLVVMVELLEEIKLIFLLEQNKIANLKFALMMLCVKKSKTW